MNIKVYVLTIHENALDGLIYKSAVLVFSDRDACLDWMKEEIKRRKVKHYNLVSTDDPNNWRFVNQDRFGDLVIEMDGMYKEVME